MEDISDLGYRLLTTSDALRPWGARWLTIDPEQEVEWFFYKGRGLLWVEKIIHGPGREPNWLTEVQVPPYVDSNHDGTTGSSHGQSIGHGHSHYPWRL